jgi:hypothetical protein
MIENVETFLEQLHLKAGGHNPDSEFCVMEAVAYVALEEWSDHPQCVSPVIASFLRNWNDSLPDEDRQMLKPYIVKIIGTNNGKETEAIRAWMCIDWLIRVFTPAFLRVACLQEHAEKLSNLKKVDKINLKIALPKIAAAWAAAWAAAKRKLNPLVKQLQQSAFELIDRMIAVKS